MARAHADRRRARAGSTTLQTSAIHLHIDRLVLHGIPQSEAPRLAAVMERELATLATQPAHFVPLAADSLRSPHITAVRTPEHTGRAAAGAVWSSIAAGAPQ
jgi:hypothetical protein